MCSLCLLFQVSGEQLFADVAKDILLYVSRDLSDKVNQLQPCYDSSVCLRVRVCSTGFMGTKSSHWGTKVTVNILYQRFFLALRRYTKEKI